VEEEDREREEGEEGAVVLELEGDRSRGVERGVKRGVRGQRRPSVAALLARIACAHDAHLAHHAPRAPHAP